MRNVNNNKHFKKRERKKQAFSYGKKHCNSNK